MVISSPVGTVTPSGIAPSIGGIAPAIVWISPAEAAVSKAPAKTQVDREPGRSVIPWVVPGIVVPGIIIAIAIIR
jgi:hypothetical protein